MKKTLAVCTVGLLAAGMTLAASAQNKIDNELDQATQIMNEMTGPQSTAGIPDAVLKDAKCVAVIPKMLKAGFVVGGQHGDG
jgi:lipid-binding SYLF domain-containing protein